MANPTPLTSPSSSPGSPTLKEYQKIKNAIREEDLNDLRAYMAEPKAVNLSGDHLLHVLIASKKKTNLVTRTVERMKPEDLEFKNFLGDTALHVAAMTGDVYAAKLMIFQNKKLLNITNNEQEIPLHKAALFGKNLIFWELLIHGGSQENARRADGSNVLHCAIMGNNTELALEIAQCYPHLMFARNSRAVTPLQLIVTIPEAFRSNIHLGFVESLIYACIPSDKSTFNYSKRIRRDEEEQNQKDYEELMDDETPSYMTKAFKIFYIIMDFPVRWMRLFPINVLKEIVLFKNWAEEIENRKKNHACSLNLITYLAQDKRYWDFIGKGRTRQEIRTPDLGDDHEKIESLDSEMMEYSSDSDQFPKPESKDSQDKKQEDGTKEDLKIDRWDESPLTLGAKMGLHAFVEKILQVCPESAKVLDPNGRNVLQVAIQHGHVKIVKIIASMTSGSNPVLPSWLLSSIDPITKNNILHFAAKEPVHGDSAALQMQHELLWFERVRKLVPKDLEYSRNIKEKTAQELFSENHIDMVHDGKKQLTEIGKTCSGLLAMVVVASSFSIPGDKDSNNNPVFMGKTAFKVFTHAYVIGLSCAATAFVAFLSLLTSNYRERDFRRSLPIKYWLAVMSFYLALVAFSVSFSCNIYLTIYGGQKTEKNLLPFICELTVFPALCCLAFIFHGYIISRITPP